MLLLHDIFIVIRDYMKIIAANLKANHTPKSIKTYCDVLQTQIDNMNNIKSNEIIIFPNQASLIDNTYKDFNIGTQNAYPILNGAFTGEIGLEVLQSLNIQHVMIGHSERRNILQENNEIILTKFNFFAKANMRIMLCIGEDNNVKDIRCFLESQLDKIDLDYPLLTIAYEPVWAIGSGRTPELSDISNIIDILHNIGVKKILYGGSVNLNNISKICKITDGVLVGGASLDPYVFGDMIKAL